MDVKSVFDDVDLILKKKKEVLYTTPDEWLVGGLPTEERVRSEGTENRYNTEQ